MRTTVTLDPDTEHLVRQRMKERGVSFKRALNDAIRDGALGAHREEHFATQVVAMGRPRTGLDRALQLAAELDDEELIRKLERGA